MTSQYRRRNSLRYPGYDYAPPGAVFVTVETAGRQGLFGAIIDGQMRHSPAGVMAMVRWQGIPARFPSVALDTFIVMPDHVHGIVMCGTEQEADLGDATVGDVVRWFKTTVYAAYGLGVKTKN